MHEPIRGLTRLASARPIATNPIHPETELR